MSKVLENKVAVVTGGASGIGRATVLVRGHWAPALVAPAWRLLTSV
ncbi:MAG: hypothetical protein ACPHUF_05640 [Gammaproteobacteria bacterium]